MIKVNFIAAVHTCRELPNHVSLQQKMMEVGKELGESLRAQKEENLKILEQEKQEQKALAEK